MSDFDGWTVEPAKHDETQGWTLEPAAPALPPKPGPRQPVSKWQAALKGIQGVPTFGFGDEMGAALQAGLLKASGDPSTFGENYRKARNENRREDQQARADHPLAYYGAGLAATVPAMAYAPAFGAAKGAGIGARLLATAGNGLAYGALNGAGDSEAELANGLGSAEYGKTAKDAALGGVTGAALGTTLHGVGAAGLYGAKKALNGIAERSPAAKLLIAKGVKGLTLGQQTPRGALNGLEESSTSAPIMGESVAHSRNAARDSWEKAVFNEGRAPGAPEVTGADLGERLSSVADGYGPAYDAIGAHPARPVTAAGGPLDAEFSRIAQDPLIYADEAKRAAAQKWLVNQATAIDPTAQRGTQTAQDLMALRSRVRAEHRAAVSSQDGDKAAILGHAEDAITQSLESQLPPEALTKLRATDAQYRQYKVVEDAVARSGDQVSQMTPAKLSAAVKKGVSSKASYAKGAGGDLRDLSQAGSEVFAQYSPPTGHRAVKLGHYGALPVALSFNYANASPKLQNAIFGETAVQKSLQGLSESALQNRFVVDALRRFSPQRPGATSLVLQDLMTSQPESE